MKERIGPPFPALSVFEGHALMCLLAYPESPHRLLKEPNLSLTLAAFRNTHPCYRDDALLTIPKLPYRVS
jgi:hypothetical protein